MANMKVFARLRKIEKELQDVAHYAALYATKEDVKKSYVYSEDILLLAALLIDQANGMSPIDKKSATTLSRIALGYTYP
jgi:hypothetical protein